MAVIQKCVNDCMEALTGMGMPKFEALLALNFAMEIEADIRDYRGKPLTINLVRRRQASAVGGHNCPKSPMQLELPPCGEA